MKKEAGIIMSEADIIRGIEEFKEVVPLSLTQQATLDTFTLQDQFNTLALMHHFSQSMKKYRSEHPTIH